MIPVIFILFVIGSILIISSFLFQDAVSEDNEKASGKNVERLLEDKLLEVKNQLDDAAEKSAGYVKNQTERELEKLSNEKIMAVSEYSDQVIDEINKNHQEVMFLYSMLNNKQKELDDTVENLKRVKQQKENEEKLQQISAREENESKSRPEKKVNETVRKSSKRTVTKEKKEWNKEEEEPRNYSNKEKILLMHQEGKSNLEIAKKLNLGIGEVRLVIDLNKGSHV